MAVSERAADQYLYPVQGQLTDGREVCSGPREQLSHSVVVPASHGEPHSVSDDMVPPELVTAWHDERHVSPDAEAELLHSLIGELQPVKWTLSAIRAQMEQLLDRAIVDTGPDSDHAPDSTDDDESKGLSLDEQLSMAETGIQQCIELVKRRREVRKGLRGIAPVGAENLLMQNLNLSEVLRAKVKYWRRVLRMGIDIRMEIPPNIHINADIVGLTDILTNVFKNAAQAMQVKRSHTQPEQKKVLIVRLVEDPAICTVYIHDNGPGIKKEHEAHLFESGFTTKPEGQGLGLQTCREQARLLNGDFHLVNNTELPENARVWAPATGATAIIEFPKIQTESPRWPIYSSDMVQMPLSFPDREQPEDQEGNR